MTDRPDFTNYSYPGGDDYPGYPSRSPYGGGDRSSNDAGGDQYDAAAPRRDGAGGQWDTGAGPRGATNAGWDYSGPEWPAAGTGATSAHRVINEPESVPDRMSWRHRAMQRRRNMPWWQELPLLLIVAFCLAVLVRTFLVQAFYIPSGSMENTLQVGDRVVVDKVIYHLRSPRRGDIVVFQGTDNWAPEYTPDTNTGFFTKMGRTLGDLVGISQPGEKDFVKRVIGVPGDTVACCDVNGHVTVNGVPLDERYISDDSPIDTDPALGRCGSRRFEPVTVGQGQLFVMGDHRLVSQDSRCQGQVPIDHVIGQARMIIWPFSHFTWVTPPSTFDKVPKTYGAAGFTPGAAVTGPAASPGRLPAGTGTIAVLLPFTGLFAKSRRARR